MVWVFRNAPQGFEELSLAEMESAGLKQVSHRFFYGDKYDLNKSAYGQFLVREVVRGDSEEEVIKNFNRTIPSPYRVETYKKKRRRGSLTYAKEFEKFHGGVTRASNPKSIIFIFTPDNKIWVAGFLDEKVNSITQELDKIRERSCISLTSQAALALINIAGDGPIVDPCCGTGLIPLASKLLNIETYAGDKSFRMLKMARKNRDHLNVKLDIPYKDAKDVWIENCSLVTDYPAERSWVSQSREISLELFNTWIPYIKSFCVILPNHLLDKLPKSIIIDKKINFTANRTIIVGIL